MQDKWNERFSSEEYVYGKEPNIFLKEFYELNPSLFKNPVLMLGDGEGRNGVYLATRGLDVTSLDYAEMGLRKAKKLAEEKNVDLKTILSDVNEFDFGKEKWGTIVLIFLHLTKDERKNLYSKIKDALLPDGLFFMEVFSVDQLNYNSGGPSLPELLYTKEELEKEFKKPFDGYRFEIIISEQKVVLLHEGKLHEGEGSVVRFVCKKVKEG
ncbi:MAG: class I SAM-dependent methyltransferase [Ignavibacteria bacterium]|jgi:SAM-dependent methyltransferase|nr:class I SAM-dependent methyltransferase [Ignavibacteria bacterium]MDH7528001.1 class I SAM-dependent methyltransferase [Ignavibacteria bacterium]